MTRTRSTAKGAGARAPARQRTTTPAAYVTKAATGQTTLQSDFKVSDAWWLGFDKHAARFLNPEGGEPNAVDAWRAIFFFLVATRDQALLPPWMARYLSEVAAEIYWMPDRLAEIDSHARDPGGMALAALKLTTGRGRGGPLSDRQPGLLDRQMIGRLVEDRIRAGEKQYLAIEGEAKTFKRSRTFVRECYIEWRDHWSRLEEMRRVPRRTRRSE